VLEKELLHSLPSDAETLSFFDLVQVPVEVASIDLSVFRGLLSGLLCEGQAK
jgi:hypothetical protein